MEIDINSVKESLLQIKTLDNQIQERLAEVYQLKVIACSTSMNGADERVQTSGGKDKLGAIVSKMVDLENEIDTMVDDFVDLKNENLKLISLLDNERYKLILIKKYFEYESIYDIADELNMTVRGCKKAHRRALENILKIKNTIYCI